VGSVSAKLYHPRLAGVWRVRCSIPTVARIIDEEYQQELYPFADLHKISMWGCLVMVTLAKTTIDSDPIKRELTMFIWSCSRTQDSPDAGQGTGLRVRDEDHTVDCLRLREWRPAVAPPCGTRRRIHLYYASRGTQMAEMSLAIAPGVKLSVKKNGQTILCRTTLIQHGAAKGRVEWVEGPLTTI
jgi:hypothetical protein